MLTSQAVGFLTTAAVLAVSAEQAPALAALAWAGAAGIAGIVGLAFFYRALSGGTMALIAPLAGVIGAAVPAAMALIGGEQLSPVRIMGLLGALVAIVLIALPRWFRAPAATAWQLGPADVLLAVMAGLGFAGFFLFLDRSAAAGAERWWPMFAVRLVGLTVLVAALALVVGRRRGAIGPRVRHLFGLQRLRRAGGRGRGLLSVAPLFVIAGLGDLGGNVLFLLANEFDALAVAVVLSSLYPVVTAVLAATFLSERLSWPQLAGVGLAALAAGLIGVG